MEIDLVLYILMKNGALYFWKHPKSAIKLTNAMLGCFEISQSENENENEKIGKLRKLKIRNHKDAKITEIAIFEGSNTKSLLSKFSSSRIAAGEYRIAMTEIENSKKKTFSELRLTSKSQFSMPVIDENKTFINDIVIDTAPNQHISDPLILDYLQNFENFDKIDFPLAIVIDNVENEAVAYKIEEDGDNLSKAYEVIIK